MHRLTTLGALDLRDGHGRQVRDVLAQPKRVALLAFLAFEGRRAAVARERLLALFWPESDEARARNALSQALYHLRQNLPADALRADATGAIRVDPGALWCDASAFEDALEAGELELALDLYRGPFCQYLSTDGVPEVEHWLDGRRAALDRAAIAGGRSLAQTSLRAGDSAAAARAAARTLALHPGDEHDVRTLLGLMSEAGDRAGALAAWEARRRHLAALEAEPDPETAALAAAIRALAPATVALRARPSPSAATRAGETAAPGHRRTRHPARVAWLAAAAVVIAGAARLFSREATAAAGAANTIAVFPFAVRGDARHAYLSDGLVDLLSATLDGSNGLSTIDPRTVIAARRKSGEAAPAQIAARLGAGRYVDGEVHVAAGHLRLRATLRDGRTGAQLGTASAEGDTAALFDVVDAIAARLLSNLVPGRDTALTRLGAVSTHSLPALRAFLEGEQALRNGRDGRALSAFLEAATLDTTFALAQYRVAVTATWAASPSVGSAGEWAARATRNASRLTPTARDLLTAYRAYREGRILEAERLYRAVTAARPDNVEAWLMLGEIMAHFNPLRGRSTQEGWQPFARALELSRANPHALLHLARMAAEDGRGDAVDSLNAAYHSLFGAAERSLEMDALAAMIRPDSSRRASALAQARIADDYVVVSVASSAAAYAQDMRAAREFAVIGRQPGRAPFARRGMDRIMIGADVGAGNWDQSSRWAIGIGADEWVLQAQALAASEPQFGAPAARLRELRRLIDAHPRWLELVPVGSGVDTRSPLGVAFGAYLSGLLSARLGDTATAHRKLAAVTSLARTTDGAADLAAAVRAALARVRGDTRGALVELRTFRLEALADGTIPSWRVTAWGAAERFAMAELLAAQGQDDEALALYASFFGGWDLPFAAVAQLRRGEILERRGDRVRARFHFSRAAAMWADADADFQPLLARARAGVARTAAADE